MSIKDNNNGKKNNDDLNIKSHLNTSLDFNGISVSEDLINRTLEAIKKQPADINNITAEDIDSKKVKKKVISWNRYVRGIAGVAAACLVVLAGYQVMKSFSGINKMDMDNSLVSPDYDKGDASGTQESEANDDNYTALAENNTDDGTVSDTQPEVADSAADIAEYTITGKSAEFSSLYDEKEESEAPAASSLVPEEGAGTDRNYESVVMDENGNQLLTFLEICILTPEQLESISIINKSEVKEIAITDQKKIEGFYTMMEKHTYTYATDGAVNPNYTVDFISPEQGEASYTISVGETVTVRFAGAEEVKETIYHPTDYKMLQADLDQFFIENSR
ncbi:MAG: hypothetical protein K0S76_27 [Herbinix sp.]|nr:hypothetical protein [Herbinix sp.]